MRAGPWAGLLLTAALAGPLAAQDRPPESPAAPNADAPAAPAPAPSAASAERPRSRPDTPASTAGPAPKADASPAPSAKGVSQGRLIPPGEMPPDTPGAKGAPVPPDTPGAEAAAAEEPPAPTGPPLPETLRESDFHHAACRLELFRLGATFREIPALAEPGQRDCGILRPIEVTEILPGIALEGGAAMRCDTARELAHWMKEVVIPAASHLPGSPRPTALALGTTYQCRAVVGSETTAKVSEHALGNAIDIAAFGFDDGARIEIAPAADRGDLAVAFQNAVQGSACLFFATVLGPGSNAAHDDHLHLDIKARNGGYRLCQ